MAYTDKEKEEIFNTVCHRVSEGESLNAVLDDKDLPTRATVYKWFREDECFLNNYVRAREIRADIIFDEMFDIADNGTNDYVSVDIGDGVEAQKVNTDHIQRSKLRIDTRKWILSKMNPKKYGDKLEVEQVVINEDPKIGLSIDGVKIDLKI